jgi:16S rRNA (uracil1498-N3)-methyltransferase
VRWLPNLHLLEKFDAVLPRLGNYDLVLIGSLYDGAQPLRDVPMAGKTKVALLIGPEGDFSPEEVAAAVAAGAVPVSFGDRILRTETAAIFGLSVLAYELL